MSSSTTSVRLPEALRAQLDARARRLRVGRNRIVVEALESYLRADQAAELAAEARRQSLRAGDSAGVWDAMAEKDAWQ